MQEQIKGLQKFVGEYQFLIDFFASEFLTSDYYKRFPSEWKYLESQTEEEILNLTNFERYPESLQKFINSSNLKIGRVPILNSCKLDKDILIGMNLKKQAETTQISFTIDSIARKHNATHILDLGAGQGYLSSVLALKYGYHVIAIDSDENQSSAGELRFQRIKNLCMYHKAQEKGSLRYITRHISIDIDLDHLFLDLYQIFPDTISKIFVVVGLHTCGNLAVSMIRGFCEAQNQCIKSLVNLGCCYQLLTEKDDITHGYSELDAVTREDLKIQQKKMKVASKKYGFPMSNQLSSFKLGVNARMTACQPSERLSNIANVQESVRKLGFRCILQKLLEDHKIIGIGEKIVVKSRGKQTYKDFLTFVKEVLKTTDFHNNKDSNQIKEITDDAIEKVFANNKSCIKQIFYIWFLRGMMADNIESLILLDRLVFAKDSGFEAELIPMVDAKISPRNMAIIISK